MEQERDITTDTLMIHDNDTPVAIAGIMGGLDSEITEETNSLVLESANFDGERATALVDGFSRREAVEELCRKCGFRQKFGME